MDPETSEIAEPPNLRLLRRLVTVLTVTMIVGVVTIVSLLVTTMLGRETVLTVPDTITIPGEESPQAYTIGSNWSALITTNAQDQDHIHIYDKHGTLRQTIRIEID